MKSDHMVMLRNLPDIRKLISKGILLLALMIWVSAAVEDALISKDTLLHTAFSLLEEGNPFQQRYNQIAGDEVQSRLPLGVPYLWGGRTASHLFAKEPDYVVLPLWTNSRVYYRAGRNYLYGFDCVGFVRWLWEESFQVVLPTLDEMLGMPERQIMPGTDPTSFADRLQIGDLLIMDHPGRHVSVYIGTLRMYGYTEEVFSEDGILDWPLVIHCSVNAQIAGRFQELIENGLPKYRSATVTDGGVCVSIIVPQREKAPSSVLSQEQLTSYYTLPDGTWLTVLPWNEIVRHAWVRMR